MARRIPRITGLVLVLLIVGTIGYEYAADRRPAAERTAMLARGHELYGTLCHECHGDHMQGQTLPTNGLVVPPLNKRGFRVFFYTMPAGMEGFVADTIGKGRPEKGMPAWTNLSAQDRASIALYIHAVNVGDVPVP